MLAANTISRGEASGVRGAVEVRGRFALISNHFFGFDEPDTMTLCLYPDRLGQPLHNLYRDNVFEQCASVIAESAKDLWAAAEKSGNVFVSCGAALK